VQIQVSLGAAEDDPDRFQVAIHSRPEQSGEEDEAGEAELPWTRHSSGVLTAQEPAAAGFEAPVWPPPGAQPIAVEDLYEGAAERGLEYGPAFQGLEAAWRVGEDLYGEVSLAQEQVQEAPRFGIHPALLDAAVHLLLLDPDPAGGARLPFGFDGVRLGAGAGASKLRVRIALGGDRARLDAIDEAGDSIVSIESLSLRPLDLAQLQAPTGAGRNALYRIEWKEIALSEARDSAVEVFDCAVLGEESGESTHAQTAGALEAIQAFLADESLAGKRMAVVTEGAMAAADGESPDPAAAAVWGLVRAVQSECPGRFLLVDSDRSEASQRALPHALAQEAEPQLALREGAARAPRLTLARIEPRPQPLRLDPEGTVLVTGGLSGLGAIAARHLAGVHGARHMLLTSRRGPATPGAAALVAELAELGCEARAVACDVSDPVRLEALLTEVPAGRPLTAVVHCAGVVDGGVIGTLDPERLSTVFGPKADAAWQLHELTADADLAAFVLYSSAVAVFGAPGQGNYAAASSFLDGLAQLRHRQGLPATTIAWGVWEVESERSEADGEQPPRAGLAPLSTELGLELLDRALAGPEPFNLAIPLEKAALRHLAKAGVLPPLLSDLARIEERRSTAAARALAGRIAKLPYGEREPVILGAIREEVAIVLGHASPTSVEPDLTLLEAGLDSLGAMELAGRLATITGIELPPAAAFDHPTPAALARHLNDLLVGEQAGSSENGAREGGDGATLTALLAHSHENGRAADAIVMLTEASKFRPSFQTAAELDELPFSATIARQGTPPHLVCLPSFVVGSGPHQFARIARALDGRRRVTALSLPGSRRGDRLPASWDVALDVLAEATLAVAAGEPYVIVGYSGGGALARGLTERLESSGGGPEGLAMIDSYAPTGPALAEVVAANVGRLLAMGNGSISIDDDQLLTMGAYLRLLSEWEPGEIEAADLMLRAAEEEGTATIEAAGLPAWQRTRATVEVPGDHFAVIADRAQASADAIDAWIVDCDLGS
jgi:pimaricinolide synthase PimS1